MNAWCFGKILAVKLLRRRHFILPRHATCKCVQCGRWSFAAATIREASQILSEATEMDLSILLVILFKSYMCVYHMWAATANCRSHLHAHQLRGHGSWYYSSWRHNRHSIAWEVRAVGCYHSHSLTWLTPNRGQEGCLWCFQSGNLDMKGMATHSCTPKA